MKNNANEEKITELYLKNKTYREISLILNVSKDEIQRVVKEKKLCSERKKNNIKIIKEGLNKKKSRDQIAEELCVEPYKVSNLAGVYKIPTQFRKNRMENKEKTILELYKKEPISISKMAEKTGFPYPFCNFVYKKYNLTNIIIRKKYYRKMSEKEFEEIIADLKRKEKSLAQIGREHTVSRQWIAHIKNKNKL